MKKAVSFFISIDLSNNQVSIARLKRLSEKDLKTDNCIPLHYYISSKELDQDYEGFIQEQLYQYETSNISNHKIIRYDFINEVLPVIGRTPLKTYIEKKLLPFINEKKIEANHSTTLGEEKKYRDFNTNVSAHQDISSANWDTALDLIYKHQNKADLVQKILNVLIYNHDRNFNDDRYSKVVSVVKETVYFRKCTHTNPLDVDLPIEVEAIHFFQRALTSTEFETLYMLYNFQQSDLAKNKIDWINPLNDRLTKKQIEYCGWNLSDAQCILSSFRRTNYYKTVLQKDYPFTTISPYYLLVAADKIRLADHHASFVSMTDDEDDITHIENEERFCRESGILENIAIKLELLQSYPIDYPDLFNKIIDLKKDLAFSILMDIPFIEQFKIPIEKLEAKLNNKFIEKDLPVLDNKINDEISVDMEKTSSQIFHELSQKYKYNDYLPFDPHLIYTKGYNSTYDSLFELFHNSNIYPFLYRKPAFRTTINISPKISDDFPFRRFVDDYMKALGYRDVPYVAFPIHEKDKFVIEIVAENYVLYHQKLHPVCSVLNHIKAPRIFAPIRLKYHLSIQQNISNYLSETPKPSGNKNDEKLKI